MDSAISATEAVARKALIANCIQYSPRIENGLQ
jgi:hypothetical protein